LVSWNSSSDADNNQQGWLMSSPDALAVFESLGILLAALAGTEKGLNALSVPGAEGTYVSTDPSSWESHVNLKTKSRRENPTWPGSLDLHFTVCWRLDSAT
jgi:hypothetical protein